MPVVYAIPTLNQLDWVLEKHIPSIGDNLVEELIIHTSGFTQNEEQAQKIKNTRYPTGTAALWTSTAHNLGVAASWNLFLHTAFEVKEHSALIIANDDIILGENTLQSMLDKAKQFPEAVISAGPEDSKGNEFSLFYMPKTVYDIVGKFDEQFYPAYFEDNDYQHRMKLKNIALIKSGGDAYYHKGSATINTYTPDRLEQHHNDFRRNQMLYVQKWGGTPGNEVK